MAAPRQSISELVLRMSAGSVREVYDSNAASVTPLSAAEAARMVRASTATDYSDYDPNRVDLTIAGLVGVYSEAQMKQSGAPDPMKTVQIVDSLPFHLKAGRIHTVRAIAHLASPHHELFDPDDKEPYRVVPMGTRHTDRIARRYIEAYPPICETTYGEVATDTFSLFRARWMANYAIHVLPRNDASEPNRAPLRTTRVTIRELFGQQVDIDDRDWRYVFDEAVLANRIDSMNAHTLMATGRMRVWVNETTNEVVTGDTLITDAVISAKYHPHGHEICEALIKLYWLGPNSTPIGLAKALAVAADPATTGLAQRHAQHVRAMAPQPVGRDFPVFLSTAVVEAKAPALRTSHGGKGLISTALVTTFYGETDRDEGLGYETVKYTGDAGRFDRLDANHAQFPPDDALIAAKPVVLYEPLAVPPESSSSSSSWAAPAAPRAPLLAGPGASALTELAELASQEHPKTSGKVPRKQGVERKKTPYDPLVPVPEPVPEPRARPSHGGKHPSVLGVPEVTARPAGEVLPSGRRRPSAAVLAKKAATRRRKAMATNAFGLNPWGQEPLERWLVRFLANPAETMGIKTPTGKYKGVSGAQVHMYVDEAFQQGAKPTARELAFMMTKRCDSAEGGWVPERFMLFYTNSVRLYGEAVTKQQVAEMGESLDALLRDAAFKINDRRERQEMAGTTKKPKKAKKVDADDQSEDGDENGDDSEMEE